MSNRKPFRYGEARNQRRLDNHPVRPRPNVLQELLTGIVQVLKASDIEERFARALGRYRRRFKFQLFVPSRYAFPGEAKEIDFVVGDQPVNVHGYIGHFHTLGQRAADRIRDLMIDEVLVPMGFKPIITITQTDLENQEMADKTVRRYFR